MSSAEDPQDTVSRAEAALDRLVREPADPWWSRIGTTRRRPLVVVVVVVAALAVAGMVLTQRRPPPIDDRLPVADASAPPGTPGTATGATGTAAPAGSAVPTTVAGSGAAAEPPTRVVVHVAGAVALPGVVDLPAGSRVVDAVQAAGGLRADADPDRVNLAAPLEDGQHVDIPVLGAAPVAPLAPASPSGGTAGPGASGSGAPGGGTGGTAGPGGLVDLNSADAAALDELPGVGPSTAAAIIAHREKDGAFSSVDGLLDVRGIGEAKLEALRDLVTVGG